MVINEIKNDCQYWRFDFSHVERRVLLSNNFIQSSQTTTQSWIKMIFNVVVCPVFASIIPAFQPRRYLFPTVAQFAMRLKQQQFFFIAPNIFIDVRIQVIVPSFPTLFSCPFYLFVTLLEFISDRGPIIDAHLCNNLFEKAVLLN